MEGAQSPIQAEAIHHSYQYQLAVGGYGLLSIFFAGRSLLQKQHFDAHADHDAGNGIAVDIKNCSLNWMTVKSVGLSGVVILFLRLRKILYVLTYALYS